MHSKSHDKENMINGKLGEFIENIKIVWKY